MKKLLFSAFCFSAFFNLKGSPPNPSVLLAPALLNQFMDHHLNRLSQQETINKVNSSLQEFLQLAQKKSFEIPTEETIKIKLQQKNLRIEIKNSDNLSLLKSNTKIGAAINAVDALATLNSFLQFGTVLTTMEGFFSKETTDKLSAEDKALIQSSVISFTNVTDFLKRYGVIKLTLHKGKVTSELSDKYHNFHIKTELDLKDKNSLQPLTA